jgi:hypothetical protein
MAHPLLEGFARNLKNSWSLNMSVLKAVLKRHQQHIFKE